MSSNRNLHRAKRAKNDEFFTQRKDVDAELRHYEAQFRGKVVYCNCDGEESAFFQYFRDNFERLGLKKLIATKYVKGGKGVKLVYEAG